MALAKRGDRLKKQTKARLAEAFENFAEGCVSFCGSDPRLLVGTDTDLFPVFTDVYSILLWLSKVQHVGTAKSLAQAPRRVLPAALALAARGAYEVSAVQVRFAYEAIISFLYFRDHPREYELALDGRDVWDNSRPSAVLGYLRRLPEYRSSMGIQALGACESLYGNLSAYAHPRVMHSNVEYLSGYIVDMAMHKELASLVRALATNTAILFALSDHSIYRDSSELDRGVMRAPVKRDVWRKLSSLS